MTIDPIKPYQGHSVFSETGHALEVFKLDVEKRLCAVLGREWSPTVSIETLCAQLSTIRSETIEMCARVAEDYARNAHEHGARPQETAFEMLAESIRALSKTPEVGK